MVSFIDSGESSSIFSFTFESLANRTSCSLAPLAKKLPTNRDYITLRVACFGAACRTWTGTVSHTPLKRARLPIPPRPHIICRGEPYHSIIRIYTHFVNKIFYKMQKNNNTSCLHSDPFVVFLFAKLPSSDRWLFRTFSLMFIHLQPHAALVHVQQSFEVFPLLSDQSLSPLLPVI